MIPTYLYHYYEKSREPFLSISESDETDFKRIMNQIGQLPIEINRFKNAEQREFYYVFRNYTEKKIRSMFIEKGGKPSLEFPRYMTLGSAKWVYEMYYEKLGIIEIPLEEFDDTAISFTYSDSMLSMFIAEDRSEPFKKFKKPYHGKVFTKPELGNVIEKYGLPDETDRNNINYGNYIIEAQIWDLEVIEKYIDEIVQQISEAEGISS